MLITVITVVYNDAKGLKKTIESVVNQTYKNLEYIIIDGGSTDDGLEIIKQNESQISQWISEADKGIYDAMNKGIELATGEFILFMNAADTFYKNDSVAKLMSNIPSDVDLVYGNHEVLYDSFIKTKKAQPPSELWKGMICSHQSLFVRTAILKAKKFAYHKYSIVADYHFIFSSWLEKRKFHYVNETIASYQSGGISESKLIETRWQTRKVVLSKINNFRTQRYFVKLLAITYGTSWVRNILPKSVFEWLAKMKNGK